MTSVLTAADAAECWAIWCELLDEWEQHQPCPHGGVMWCPMLGDALDVYLRYHLRLVRLRRAQALRFVEALEVAVAACGELERAA